MIVSNTYYETTLKVSYQTIYFHIDFSKKGFLKLKNPFLNIIIC